MSFKVVAQFDTLRTVAFGGISGTYVIVGGPLTQPCRILTIVNGTNGDLFLSTDGINNMIFVPSASSVKYDISANRENPSNVFVLPLGTQFYVKQSTAPTSGAVYVEVVY